MAEAAISQSAKSDIQRTWWLWLLWGICGIIIGVLLLARPVSTAYALTWVIGIWWIVSGIIDVITAVAKRQGPWGWFIFTGIVSFLAGAFLVANTLLGLAVAVEILYYILAFTFLFVGFVRIFAGWRNSNGVGYRWTWGSLIVGILLVIFGLLMLFNPGEAFWSIVWLGGFLGISAGIMAIIFAFQVRSLK